MLKYSVVFAVVGILTMGAANRSSTTTTTTNAGAWQVDAGHSVPAHAGANPVVGYLYTTTNGEGINEVVRLARYEDGTVGDEKTYSTYARGGANHTAPALGDYDAHRARPRSSAIFC